MTEPVATATTVAATTASIPVLTVFGASLGLHPAYLVAGAFGAFVGIVLLNTVPADDSKPWWHGVLRRMVVMAASSVTAGYITPVVMSMMSFNESLQMAAAFIVGGSAQWTMQAVIRRVTRTVGDPA